MIGNFSDTNPDRPYMEVLMEWDLYHRSEEKMILLATECQIQEDQIRIGKEEEGVNLFLHIKKK